MRYWRSKDISHGEYRGEEIVKFTSDIHMGIVY
jgi:hypothetical protein